MGTRGHKAYGGLRGGMKGNAMKTTGVWSKASVHNTGWLGDQHDQDGMMQGAIWTTYHKHNSVIVKASQRLNFYSLRCIYTILLF